MIIANCRVSHFDNPLGMELGRPVFSWTVEEAEGKKAVSSRLRVYEEGNVVLDTGYAQLSSEGTLTDLDLKPRTRYTWTAAVRSDAGEEAVSAEQIFETGMMHAPWQAEWITCEKGDRHPVFSKEISLGKDVIRARLYICGLGLYEAYYRGKKIGDSYLTPFCNHYTDWLQAQTYDVTEAVKEAGTLSVYLGDGWYLGRFGFNGHWDFRYGKGYRLIAELHVTYADGSSEVIGTDDSWDVTRSDITFSNIYDGEHRDDTLSPAAPVKATVCTEEMPELHDTRSVPVKAHERFRPEIIITPAGETVVDLGQNIAGIFTLKVHEPKGTVIRLQASEILQKGNFYRDNLRSAKAEYVYISDGEEHVLRPMFTFYGYRYMKIEGVHDLKPEDFEGIALYSDNAMTAELETGNAKINRLIRNAEWGMKGNFVDVPTDCPQRDERMGWTGDAQVFSATALYFSDAYAFYRKYMYDMAREQADNDGMVPMVVPSFDLTFNNPAGGCAAVWGDATTIIPWNMYMFTGDPSILQEHYDAMKGWVEYIRKIDGDDHGWRKHFHFGDWLALDGADAPDAVIGGTEEGFIADVYYRRSALITAEAAEILGFTQDAEEYRALADHIRDELLEEYYTPSGRCAVMTQTGQILSVQNDLGKKEKHAAVLVKLLENNNRKLKTGFVGTPLLADALTKIGRDDLAYALLFNEEYPGWLYEVNLGATTIWERWNSVGADGLISSTGMNSLNHYSYGAIVQWIFERCAGLKPLEPGFASAQIAPVPHVKLGSIHMAYRSAAGEWKINWQLQGRKTLCLQISVPFGAQAQVVLPDWDGRTEAGNPLFEDVRDGICHVGSGTYVFTYEMTHAPLGLLSVDSTCGELLKKPGVLEMLLEKMPSVGPIPLRSAQDRSLRSVAEQYSIPQEVIEEMDHQIEILTK